MMKSHQNIPFKMHVFSCLTMLLTGCHGWISSNGSMSHRKLATKLPLTADDDSSNVVLRPSSDPNAFDSFKVGGCRVHRYLRDSVDDDAEYVMWYHGRDGSLDEDKSLPPLSTGRIGRATSRNGLHWEKTTEGSISEDAPDVSLGLNKESWWGFDTAHVGLGQVLLPMTTPAVISEGGVYMMYYMGGSHEETPIADYLENVPDAAANAKIKGMNLKIGVAVSQDGKSWGRVEGDHPTGACIAPNCEKDPSMRPFATVRDDDNSLLEIEEELYCGWPDVVVNEKTESKSKANKEPAFFMYYSTMTKSDKKKCIAVAVSEDGFRWSKRGICIRPDETGLDADGCARANVVRRAEYDDESGVWKSAEGWLMFYEGVSDEDGKHRIMQAESADGRNWKKVGTAFDIGADGTWDCMGVGSPHVIRMDDGSLRMYYTGQGKDGSTAIGVSKCSADNKAWVREQAQFSFA